MERRSGQAAELGLPLAHMGPTRRSDHEAENNPVIRNGMLVGKAEGKRVTA